MRTSRLAAASVRARLGSGPAKAAQSRAFTSAAVAGRSSGSFASMARRSARTAAGTNGSAFERLSGGTGKKRCFAMTSTGAGLSNNGAPWRSSVRMHPSA